MEQGKGVKYKKLGKTHFFSKLDFYLFFIGKGAFFSEAKIICCHRYGT